MRTFDFPYCFFAFEEWNPMQERCVPYFCKDRNLVVSATVAAGKTAIAEAIISYELSKPESKAVYVSPLKALSMEKYEEWTKHETFGQYKIALMDSDHHLEKPDLSSIQLVIATVESMNVCCRRRDEWLKKVRVLIFDEAHLFDHEKRGACSEALMMDLSQINPECRLICLSGTLSNAAQIAGWLNVLNGKSTNYVVSNWRPTTLYKKIEVLNELKDQIRFVKDKIKENPYEKFLIFVHSKRIGEILVDHLRKSGIRCGFFSANLNNEQKSELLTKFRAQYSGLQILVATSSLSMGVSL